MKIKTQIIRKINVKRIINCKKKEEMIRKFHEEQEKKNMLQK